MHFDYMKQTSSSAVDSDINADWFCNLTKLQQLGRPTMDQMPVNSSQPKIVWRVDRRLERRKLLSP